MGLEVEDAVTGNRGFADQVAGADGAGLEIEDIIAPDHGPGRFRPEHPGEFGKTF
jgi:hypothetical protein